MLQELAITPATVVIVVAIAALAFLAVRRLLRKGLCDCGEKCDTCSACPKAGACKSAARAKTAAGFDAPERACPAALSLAKSMQEAFK